VVAVRFITSAAGGITAEPDEVVELTEAEADVWCDGVRAERVKVDPPARLPRERATKAGREVRG